MHVFRLVWLVVLIATPAFSGTLTPEALVDLRSIREAALSPEGTRIAYTREIPRSAEDDPGKSFQELWIADVDGSPRRFAGDRERISQPRWSPDGKRVAFLSDRGDDELTGLFVIAADGGEARRWVDHDASVTAFRWSPDGTKIAFVSRDAASDEEKEDEEAGRDWVVADENYKYRRVWSFDVESESVDSWFDRNLDVSELCWTPDGKSLVLLASQTPRVDDEYMFSSLYRVTTKGEPEKVVDTPGKLAQPSISPDGRTLAYLGAISRNDPLAQSLFVVPLAGGKARNLTPGFEASVAASLWWDDDHLLVFSVERERHVPYVVHRDSGQRRKLDWPRLVVGDVDGAAGRYAVVADSPDHPRELFFYENGREPRRLTQSNPSLVGTTLARQEVIEWTSTDDWNISGVLTWPAGFEKGRRYPLVLQIHGGPEGVSMDGWTSSPTYPVQPLAARGYFVLQPNYRGSEGRGVAFSKSDHDDLGGQEFDDVLAGIDALVERGLVDGSRVGTGGWSYGGYFSAWAATRHSERFRASVVGAGLTNWIAFAGTTDIPHEMSLVHWNSWWFDEPELHWDRSPLAHLNKAATPTLIVHGAADDRVHPEQGLELYTGLRVKGIPAQFVLYPREPHGLTERAHRLDFVERSLDWFHRHLGREPVE